jgi:L-alanine-DL-glutamate epimerase-like enolase superfamily enzyme
MPIDSLIQSISISPLDLPLTEPFSIATGKQDEVKNVLIQVYLTNGIVGLGEAAPFPAVNGETQEGAISCLEKIKGDLVGKDIRSWKKILENHSNSFFHHHSALCGLQMALADAVSRYYEIPLSVLFGGSSDTLKTDMTITASDVEHAEYSAKAILNRGINTIKIKTTGQNIELDFERVKAIKNAAPSADLIIDGNCGYTLRSAIELIDRLEKENISLLFLEQPLPREQWKEMAILAKESSTKIAADESARDAKDVLRIVNDRSAHVINIKLMKCGLFEAQRMVEIAKAAGLELMIGGMVETILSMSFSAHFAAGAGGFHYADLDTPLFIKSHPFTGGFVLKGDIIKLDLDCPGHGVHLK